MASFRMELLLPREKRMGSESQNLCGGQEGECFEGSHGGQIAKCMAPPSPTNKNLLALTGGAWKGGQGQRFLQLE